MKSKHFIGIFLCSLFPSHWAAASIPVTADSLPPAYLSVTHDQAHLKVFLDGKVIGSTPLIGYPLSPGNHRLVVRSPRWPALNMTDFDTCFIAISGDTHRFTAKFAATFYLNSLPYGAEVTIEQNRFGQTPAVVPLAANEPRIVHLEKEGYEPQDVLLADRFATAGTIILQPNVLYQQQKQAEQRRAAAKLAWYRRGLYGSLLLGAISGVATIHYRGKGNDAYAAYLATANPVLMERYYDRARKYDRIAGWNYAAFEVSFILSGYFFLKSRK